MDLSIVVSSWNTRALLLECLDSLQRSIEIERKRELATPFEVEVLVVDNGSSDGSAQAVRRAHPEVRVIDLERNRGFAAGNNAALEVARGRTLLLLNSDAFPEPGALRRCVEVLDARPGVAAAGLQLLHPDGRLQNSIHTLPRAWHELVPRALLECLWPARFPSKRRPATEPIEVDAVLGACFFMRREAIDAIGPLSEDYFFFLEETDWCLRAARAGFRVLHIPDARAEHRSGASSKARYPIETRIEFNRSLYRFLETHRGRGSARAARTIRCLKSALLLPFLSLAALVLPASRRRLAVVWGVLRWHLAGCPATGGLAGLEVRIPDEDANGWGTPAPKR